MYLKIFKTTEAIYSKMKDNANGSASLLNFTLVSYEERLINFWIVELRGKTPYA